MGGCGPAGQKIDTERSAENSNSVTTAAQKALQVNQRRIINSGEATLRATRSDGSLAWSLMSEYSRLGIDTDTGSAQGFLNGVTGHVYSEGEIASIIKAKEAKSDTKSNTFKLLNDVTIQSSELKTSLTANEVEWLEAKHLFIAKGQVYVKTDNWIFGPMEILVAKPDLSEVGSPDRFEL